MKWLHTERSSTPRRGRIVMMIDRRILAGIVGGAILGLWWTIGGAGGATSASVRGPMTPREMSAVADRLSAPPAYESAETGEARRRVLAQTLRAEGPSTAWQKYVAPAVASDEDVKLSMTEHPTEGQLEALREQMRTFYADLGATIELVPEEQRLDLADKVAEAAAAVDDLTIEQLGETHAALRPYPGFWSIPAYTRNVLEQVERDRAAGQSSSPVRNAVFPPSAPMLPGLPPLVPERSPTVPSSLPQAYQGCKESGGKSTCEGGCGPIVAGGVATLFALDTAAWAAESVCSYFDGDITIFGTQIPNWAKIICIVGYAAIQTTADAVRLVYDLNQQCEGDYHNHLVNAYLDETISSRASQQSHNFHRLWELRLEIENAMLDEANTRVSLFQLPRSHGGYLNTQDDVSVRYVVADTIATLSAAGYDVRNAQTEYATAETHLAAGRFKDAFARYRLAYRAAVSVGREP